MPYITRDKNNKIIEMFANMQYVGQEYINDNSEDVLNFGKPTVKKELLDLIINKKKDIAYGGYKFTKNNEEYIFSTSKDDLSLVLSTVLAFNNDVITTINWKCNDNKFVELNKEEFLNLYMKGAAFINEQFNKEKAFIEELESQIELSNEWITEFKQRIEIW